MVRKNNRCHHQRGTWVFAIVFLMTGFVALLVIFSTNDLSMGQLILPLLPTYTIKPALSTNVLLNPGKGWVLYGMPSDHSASTLAYAAVGYMRYDWSPIEPAEGQYNWSVID